ncbi:MAG: hypothetical protein P1V51_09580 [Deltaproteobacteria bacterium]|nr:hypothetical protein [Deltaproteobacteria bacterium]
MSKEKARDDKGALIFAAVVVGLIFLAGFYLAFVVFPRQMQERRELEAVPTVSRGQLVQETLGEAVLVTGTLLDNPVIKGEDLVAYRSERWEVRYRDGENEGRWWGDEERWPRLRVAIEGGVVQTASGPPTARSAMAHELLEPHADERVADHEGTPLPHGSLRFLGVRNGDRVTLVGRVDREATLKVDYFHAGTREQLLDSLLLNARMIQIFGLLLMAAAAVIGAVVVLKKR